MAYIELGQNVNFNDIFPTWVIAYCPDNDTFFATNERYFYWESKEEFQNESDAINYFRSHLKEFWDVRENILSNMGRYWIDNDLFLWNTKERFII